MSQPGDQDPSTAAMPAADPTADPTADPAPGAQAWDAAAPTPTETYPASAPQYPAAEQYGYQAPAFPTGQQYAISPHSGTQHPQQGMVHPQPGMPYGQPPWGQAPGGSYPYPVREAPVSGLAVASLVCGIVWVYWITSILAIIFAAVAFGQIKREGRRGKGMAVAGLVLGLVWVALLVIGLIGFLVGGTAGVLPFADL